VVRKGALATCSSGEWLGTWLGWLNVEQIKLHFPHIFPTFSPHVPHMFGGPWDERKKCLSTWYLDVDLRSLRIYVSKNARMNHYIYLGGGLEHSLFSIIYGNNHPN
jgi:hypothetical protein